MKIRDLMSANVISVSPSDVLSTALAKMRKNNVHQLAILDDKNFLGFIELKKIVTKNVDITKTKVENFITSVSRISPNESVENGARLLLGSGLRAVPVIDGGKLVGIISETDIVKIVNSNKFAKDLATPCEFVSLEDSSGKVIDIMHDKNVSRVPVVENGKLIGVVGTMDLIKVLESKEHIKDKYVAAEKMQLEDVKVKTIMSSPYIADDNTPLDRIKGTLAKSEEVFVQDGDIKIITPKDLLELLLQKPKRGAFVQITNLEGESLEVQAKIDKITDVFVKKTASMLKDVEYLFIHIERHHKQGKKIKYSVRTRFSTNLGLFVSHAWGWVLVSASQDALGNLEREITKKHEMLYRHQREKKSKRLAKM